ncbi:HIT family protein [Desulfurispira natronophila]|uniref:Diadenosine tetraphosphate (Ap4A) HIT family hydrolase n=1 Tax=Desulfurispira natronophila TaxID=682562 RepID=A0A7W7Y671_9BACT|nr:hypothetical protein [Desulfurispira natronophila]MBB5022843.1 diadenosine tetraphosphate (Ap4A) HIT family hydrolase [Desulfurispira natronophila]
MSTKDDYNNFRQKFRLPDLSIKSDSKWTLSLRPQQITLGSMILSDSEGHTTFTELGPEHAPEMLAMMQAAEHVAKKLFGAERINILCLMMQDPIVHYHILPRYSQPVEKFGCTWVDHDWPKPPNMTSVQTSDCTLKSIQNEITSFLAQSNP